MKGIRGSRKKAGYKWYPGQRSARGAGDRVTAPRLLALGVNGAEIQTAPGSLARVWALPERMASSNSPGHIML